MCITKFLMTQKRMKWLHSTLLIPLQVKIKYSTLLICLQDQLKIKYGLYYRVNLNTNIRISCLSSRCAPPPFLWIFTCVIQMRCAWTSRCQNIKDYFGVYNQVFNDTKENEMITFNITHTPAGENQIFNITHMPAGPAENQIWPLLQSES